jgi:Flp pilus assembly protein TadG
MLHTRRKSRRRGGTVVECAVIYPLTFLLIIGLMVGGFGVFRYQEVASVAREGARWASVHGYQSVQEANGGATNPILTTPADVYNNAIKPGYTVCRKMQAAQW